MDSINAKVYYQALERQQQEIEAGLNRQLT